MYRKYLCKMHALLFFCTGCMPQARCAPRPAERGIPITPLTRETVSSGSTRHSACAGLSSLRYTRRQSFTGEPNATRSCQRSRVVSPTIGARARLPLVCALGHRETCCLDVQTAPRGGPGTTALPCDPAWLVAAVLGPACPKGVDAPPSHSCTAPWSASSEDLPRGVHAEKRGDTTSRTHRWHRERPVHTMVPTKTREGAFTRTASLSRGSRSLGHGLSLYVSPRARWSILLAVWPSQQLLSPSPLTLPSRRGEALSTSTANPYVRRWRMTGGLGIVAAVCREAVSIVRSPCIAPAPYDDPSPNLSPM